MQQAKGSVEQSAYAYKIKHFPKLAHEICICNCVPSYFLKRGPPLEINIDMHFVAHVMFIAHRDLFLAVLIRFNSD